jgi:hypothetical protein
MTENIPPFVARLGTLPRQEPVWYPPTISPSLDAAAIQADDGDALLTECAHALGLAAKQCYDMIDACVAIHGNVALPNAGRHVQAENVSEKVSRHGLMAIDRANVKLQQAIDQLTAKTHAPPAPADVKAESRAAEIRRVLSGMDMARRGRAISAAFAEGDQEVITALLTAPRVVSGLLSTEHYNLRERWRRTFLRQETERLDQLTKAQKALHLGGKILLDASSRCFDRSMVGAAKAADARAREAVARATS